MFHSAHAGYSQYFPWTFPCSWQPPTSPNAVWDSRTCSHAQACANPYNLTVLPGPSQPAASFFAALPAASIPASSALSVVVYLLDAEGSLAEATPQPLSVSFIADTGLVVPAAVTQVCLVKAP